MKSEIESTQVEFAFATQSTGRAFRNARIAVLLAVLVLVIAFAWSDVRARRARTDWRRTLEIGVVVVRVGDVTEGDVAALRDRARELEAVLAREMRRYRPDGPAPPFRFTVLGPVDGTPPPTMQGEGVLAAARHTLDLFLWTRDKDSRAHFQARAFDSRIYVAARPRAVETRASVEGDSEPGGRVGTVSVELDEASADFALGVIAHEMLHTLGATDKYDADGRVTAPGGLAEPELEPLYPQRLFEVMTRGRPIAPGVERSPGGIEELGVGPATAAEIRWTPAPPGGPG